MPGGWPGGGGWALLELTDALMNLTTRPGLVTYVCWPGYICDNLVQHNKQQQESITLKLSFIWILFNLGFLPHKEMLEPH